MVDDLPITKLRRHQKLNRVVVVSDLSGNDILKAINMSSDTVYGVKVLEDLGCTIVFFKNRKLAASALKAANDINMPMYSQTTKTDLRYAVNRDLTKQNIASLVKEYGNDIVSLNLNNTDGAEFWAIGTHTAIKNKKRFKFTPIRTDLMVFRFAFNVKKPEASLKKLVSAVSNQWKVKIEDSKVENGVAYISVLKEQINTNVTQFVNVGNSKFKNLSYSAKIAKSLANRVEHLEKQTNDMSTTISKLAKDVSSVTNRKFLDSIKKIKEDIASIFAKLELLSKSTAHQAKGNGRSKRRVSSKF